MAKKKESAFDAAVDAAVESLTVLESACLDRPVMTSEECGKLNEIAKRANSIAAHAANKIGA